MGRVERSRARIQGRRSAKPQQPANFTGRIHDQGRGYPCNWLFMPPMRVMTLLRHVGVLGSAGVSLNPVDDLWPYMLVSMLANQHADMLQGYPDIPLIPENLSITALHRLMKG